MVLILVEKKEFKIANSTSLHFEFTLGGTQIAANQCIFLKIIEKKNEKLFIMNKCKEKTKYKIKRNMNYTIYVQLIKIMF